MFERPSQPPLSEKQESPLITKAYLKALESFEDEEEIDPTAFENFDQKMVEHDMKRTGEMERLFEKEATPEDRLAKKYATILEAIIHEQVELNDWLGPDVITRKASRFDDIFNGVDSIAEFPVENSTSHFALSLDVTFAAPEKKFQRIRKEINQGTLTEVKYFESSDERFQGSLSFVPRLIVGVDRRQIERLANLWVSGKRKELKNDPVQIQILDELLIQLKTFRKYADEHAPEKTHDRIQEIYDQSIKLVTQILRDPEKQELRKKPETQQMLQQDRFYSDLEINLKRIFTDKE